MENLQHKLYDFLQSLEASETLYLFLFTQL
jgi:hypothetical protein